MGVKGRRCDTGKRQEALEFIKGNPGVLGKAIIEALGWEYDSGSKRLQLMCDLKELKREQAKVKQATSNRIARAYRYWAIVDEVLPHGEVVRILEEIAEEKEVAAPEEEDIPIWVTRNTKPNRPAIQNQGGQGASRPRVGCSLSTLD